MDFNRQLQLLLLLMIFQLFSSCAHKSSLTLSPNDNNRKIAFIKDNNSIHLADLSGISSELVKYDKALIRALSCSPNGKYLAYFLSINGEAQIMVLNRNDGSENKLGTVKHNWANLKRPLWSPDNEKISVIDSSGILTFTLDGKFEFNAEKTGIIDFDIHFPSFTTIYTNGKEIFILNKREQIEEGLLEKFKSKEVIKDIRRIVFSPSGDEIAVGTKKDLLFLSLTDTSYKKVYSLKQPIYWMSWPLNSKQLFFLSGL